MQIDLPNGSTELLALFGAQLDRSPSPATHTRWANERALNWIYLPISAPGDESFLKMAQALMESPHFRGANITNPFKTAALRLSGVELDASARHCGAANTLYRKSQSNRHQWRLANTDLAGCSETLQKIFSEHSHEDLESLECVILGTGAMAHTCLAAINQKTTAAVAPRVQCFGRALLQTHQFNEDELQKAKVLLVINTLPSSTSDEAKELAQQTLATLARVSKGESKHLFDLAYGHTELHSIARNSGWSVVNGDQLFEIQARASFTLWARPTAPILPTALQPIEG